MSRLVVVSNRVALPGDNHAGGLAVGLNAALGSRGGLWFGWSGRVVREQSGHLTKATESGVTYVTLDLSRRDYVAYYNGFANRTLWPLLHFRLDLVDYTRETRLGYFKVNALFADRLAPLLREDDVIWVHDYHLIPLAALLRRKGIGCRMGFFLHIPMPSSEILTALPDHAGLFEALYAYDLVGFQTHQDVERFIGYTRSLGNGMVCAGSTIRTPDGRRLEVAAFPIGIDAKRISHQAVTATSKPAVRTLRESLAGRKLAIGADRLDYSKGLPERFESFSRYLESCPDKADRMTLLQIAPVSRGEVPEYKLLRSQLEQIAGHVNGLHAEPNWTPIRYVNRSFSHPTLTGFYRLASVGVVTPLRDGMNLVAKEYVASQDPFNPGVLILSLFAGAAAELRDAVLVNPYDLDGVADALSLAANMPLSERRERWETLMARVRRHDIHFWCDSFLEALQADGPGSLPVEPPSPPEPRRLVRSSS